MGDSAANTTSPTNPPYSWVGEPNQRTSFGILSFCFSTLIICVWSTVHFNVPRRRQTNTLRFILQVAWMLIALLAPEVLLYFAVNERFDAGFLMKKVREYHPELVKPGMMDRIRNYIRGRVNSSEVSTQYQATMVWYQLIGLSRSITNPLALGSHASALSMHSMGPCKVLYLMNLTMEISSLSRSLATSHQQLSIPLSFLSKSGPSFILSSTSPTSSPISLRIPFSTVHNLAL